MELNLSNLDLNIQYFINSVMAIYNSGIISTRIFVSHVIFISVKETAQRVSGSLEDFLISRQRWYLSLRKILIPQKIHLKETLKLSSHQCLGNWCLTHCTRHTKETPACETPVKPVPRLPSVSSLYSCYIYFIAPGLYCEGAKASHYVANWLQTSKANNSCQS